MVCSMFHGPGFGLSLFAFRGKRIDNYIINGLRGITKMSPEASLCVDSMIRLLALLREFSHLHHALFRLPSCSLSIRH